MKISDFHQMYIAELQELHSAEELEAQALPSLADQAQNPQLKGAMEDYLDQTNGHRGRLEDILQRHGSNARAHRDQSMQAIIDEAKKWANSLEMADLRDAGLIASTQRMIHYEMAVYGTLASWAQRLGHDEDARTLHAILEEAKSTDDKLTELAKTTINPQAA